MIDLEQFPPEMRDQIKKDIEEKGEWLTSHSIYLAPLWRMIHDLKDTDTDICWLATTLHMVNFFSTKDPSPVHFVIAREEIKKKCIDDDRAVDSLARELVTYCQKFQQQVTTSFSKSEDSLTALPMNMDGGLLIPDRTSMPGYICERNGCNSFDLFFCDFIETIGKTGKEAADSIRKDSEKRNKIFKDSEYNPERRPQAWNLWISSEGCNTSVFSPYLSILAAVVWGDSCSIQWERWNKNVPALTQGVHPSVAKILSHRIETKKIDDQLHIFHEEKIIANLPTIDPKLIPAVTKGIGSLNSLYHHKLIRFECRTGFENWITGKPDVRLLKFDRGCSEIAERLGLNNNKSIEEIKNILHAQAHLHFLFEDGSSGNLIALTKFRSAVSGREDGIMITLGPQLLPHYTFQTSKRDRLLIPVPDLPPLISSSNSHASQAALQMLVMQKLADHSIEYADVGSVEITKDEWDELAKEAGLPASLSNQVLERWISDGADKPRFLIKTANNRYSLGQAYQKEEAFLKDQGFLRKQRQKSGEKSVMSRKKKLGL